MPPPEESRLGLPSSFKFKMSGRNLGEIVAKGIINTFVIALSVTVFLVFVLGSYDYFKNVESNKCEMTWMFEYPEYIVSIFNKLLISTSSGELVVTSIFIILVM